MYRHIMKLKERADKNTKKLTFLLLYIEFLEDELNDLYETDEYLVRDIHHSEAKLGLIKELLKEMYNYEL